MPNGTVKHGFRFFQKGYVMRHRRVRKIRSLMLALATRRPFASAAATAAASASPLVVTRLQNGVNVAVAEDVGLLSRVSLVMQTGSRQQAAPGAAHILKNLLFRVALAPFYINNL